MAISWQMGINNGGVGKTGGTGSTSGTGKTGKTDNNKGASKGDKKSVSTQVQQYRQEYSTKLSDVRNRINNLFVKMSEIPIPEKNIPDCPVESDYTDESAYNEALEEYKNSQNEYAEALEEYKNACDEIQSQINELKELEEQYQNILDELNEITEDNIPDDIKDKIDEAIKKANDAFEDIKNKENEKYTNTIDTIKSKQASIETQIAAINTELEALVQVEMPELAEFIHDGDFDADGYKAKVREFVDAQDRIAELTAKLEDLTKQLEVLTDASEAINSTLDSENSYMTLNNLRDIINQAIAKGQDIFNKSEQNAVKVSSDEYYEYDKYDKTKDSQTEVMQEKRMSYEEFQTAMQQINNTKMNLQKRIAGLSVQLLSLTVLEFPKLEDFINEDGSINEEAFADKVIEYVRNEKEAERISAELDKIAAEMDKVIEEQNALVDRYTKENTAQMNESNINEKQDNTDKKSDGGLDSLKDALLDNASGISDVEYSLSQVNMQKAALYAKYLTGEISQEEYDKLNDKLNKKQEELEQELETLNFINNSYQNNEINISSMEDLKEYLGELASKISDTEYEISQLQMQKVALEKKYQDGDISEDEYNSANNEYSTKMNRLESELNALNNIRNNISQSSDNNPFKTFGG